MSVLNTSLLFFFTGFTDQVNFLITSKCFSVIRLNKANDKILRHQFINLAVKQFQ